MSTIIQIPVDGDLLRELDQASKAKGVSRSAFIRDACRSYLSQLELEEAERAYVRGYELIPETPDLGEAQLKMLHEVLDKEEW